MELISFTGGAPVSAVLRRTATAALRAVISSDAATDSSPPGLGGYCHGLYWYLRVTDEWLEWLHITVLELLATGGSAMAFEPHTRLAHDVVLQSDALATPCVLSRHKTRSPNLAMAHHLLLRERPFRDMSGRASIGHLFGHGNPFSDAISRSLWRRFHALCGSIGVRPVLIETPPPLITIIETLVAYARSRGERIKVTHFTRSDPVIPPEMLALGRHSPACEEADAVSLSARLHQRLKSKGGGSTRGPPASARLVEPANRVISSRLAAALHMPASAAAPSEPPVPPSQPAPPRPPAPARARQLSTDVIAGMRVPAVPASLAPAPTVAKKRKADDLRAATRACATARAAGLSMAGFANSPYG